MVILKFNMQIIEHVKAEKKKEPSLLCLQHSSDFTASSCCLETVDDNLYRL